MAKRTKGLFRDCRPIDQPEGTYRNLVNGVVNDELGAIFNEKGNKALFNLPSGNRIIGSISISPENLVLFSAPTLDDDNNLQGQSEIGIYEDGIYSSFLSDSALNFDPAYPIQAELASDFEDNTIVVFTDGLNPPRRINLNTDYSQIDNIAELNLFQSVVSSPLSTFTSVIEGGNLTSGKYCFFIAYEDDDETVTNKQQISDWIFVTDDYNRNYDEIAGAPPETPTSKAIQLDISDLDIEYPYYFIYVVQEAGNQLVRTAQLPKRSTASSTTTIVYQGTEDQIDLSINDILINNAHYDTAGTITKVADQLYLGNLSKNPDLGFQKFANNIDVVLDTETLSGVTDETVENSYKDPETAVNKRSYARDDVYALYISLLLRDGSETVAYHIPGRRDQQWQSQSGTLLTPTLIPDDTDGTPATANPFATISSVDTSGVDATVDYDIKDSSDTVVTSGSLSVPADSFDIVANGFADELSNEVSYLNCTHEGSGTISAESVDSDGLHNQYNGYYIVFSNSSNVTISGDNALSGGADPDGYLGDDTFTLTYPSGSIDATISVYDTDTLEDLVDKAKSAYQAITEATDNFTFHKRNDSGTYYLEAKSIDETLGDGDYMMNISTNNSGTSYGTSTPLAAISMNDPIPSSHDNYDEAKEVTGSAEPKYYEFFGRPDKGGMGYWENQDEQYPNTEDFDVFDLDANGDPLQIDTLREENVTHHRFPSHYDRLIYDGSNTRILGFHLENVKIPNEIKDRVIGFKVYRARRGDSNKLSIGFGLAGRAFESTKNSREVYIPPRGDSYYDYQTGLTDYNDPRTTNTTDTFALFDFHNMRTRRYLGDFTHINVLSEYVKSGDVEYQENVDNDNSDDDRFIYNWIGGDNFDQSTLVDPKHALRAIKAKSYIPNNSAPVELSGLGFDKDMFNKDGVSHILYQYENREVDTDTGVATDSGGLPIMWRMVEMRTLRRNLYRSFANQELVWTGYQENDISNFTKDGSPNYSTGTIFGGDCFINHLYYVVAGKTTNDYGQRNMYHTLVQSYDNIDMRHEGEHLWENFYPKSTFQDVIAPYPLDDTGLVEDFSDVDNWMGYNDDYSPDKTIKPAFPYNPYALQQTDFSNRIIRNQGDDRQYRRFLETDFNEIPRSGGHITNLESFQGTLFIHSTNNLYRTHGKEEMVVQDIRAYIGSGNIFDRKPTEMFNEESGYAGLSNSTEAVKSKYGYFFVDKYAKQVYVMSDGLNEISQVGLSNEFNDILSENLWSYFDYNRVPEVGITVGYDPYHQRLFLTKRDFEFTDLAKDDLSSGHVYEWDYDNNQFIRKDSGGNVLGTFKLKDSSSYVNADHTTVSYLPQQRIWASFHSFYPDQYTHTRSKFLTIKDNQAYEHNVNNRGYFYGAVQPFKFGFVSNKGASISKRAVNINYIQHMIDQNDSYLRKTFDKFRIYNSYQDSGETQLIYFTDTNGNVRPMKNRWYISRFRDLLKNGAIDSTKPWYERSKLVDNYFVVELILNNNDNNLLYLYDTDVEIKPYRRSHAQKE